MSEENSLNVILKSLSEMFNLRIALFAKNDTEFVLGFDSAAVDLPKVAISCNSLLVTALQSALGDAVFVNELTALNSSEMSILQYFGSHILIPIKRNELLAILTISETIVANHQALFNLVKTCAELAIVNTEAREHALRTRLLNQELITAREMYEDLFPKSFSKIEGIDCAGQTRQVFEIGGDYYDFIELADGKFAFVIGDVSGKGITAALMMANLRAALRREMSRSTLNLAGLMTNLNQLVRETSPSNRYITLFYAQYDPRTSRLQYVNAGHQPPLLLRRRPVAQPVKLLTLGGMPIGILENTIYEQGTEILQRGDVFVAFTDGINEAMDVNGEEWGLQNLISEVSDQCDAFSSSGLISHLFQRVDSFSSGAKQHDDMSVIVIKATDT